MVVDVDFNPTKGAEKFKIRPAIVVSHNSINARSPVILVVPVTGHSVKKAQITWMVKLNPSGDNGLDKPSLADCLQVRSIDHKHRVTQIHGLLNEKELSEIDKQLKLVMQL
jgi:mRNA interferase MazF